MLFPRKFTFYSLKQVFVALFIFSFFIGKTQQIKPLQLILAMQDSIEAIKTVRFKVVAIERIQGNYVKVTSDNKIQTKPRKLYLHNKEKTHIVESRCSP